MRTQAERDEQTVDIMAALLVAAIVWGVVVVLVAIVVGEDLPPDVATVLAVVAGLGFVATVIGLLRKRR